MDRSWIGLDPLESRQLLAFVLWDGGGGDSNWNNPLNWSGDTLPGAADNVLIDTPGHPTIHRASGASDTIASLWTLNPLDISGGSLTVNGQWKQSAPLFISGGHIHGPGNMIVNGDTLWIGGTIDGGGNILVYPGHQLTIGGTVTLGRSIYNNGALRWSDGDLTTNGGTIQNLTGRTFTIASGGTLTSSGPDTTFINFGTLLRDGAANTTTTINVRFSNYPANVLFSDPREPGTVEVRSGTLSFTGAVLEKSGTTVSGNSAWMVTSSAGRLLLPGPDIASIGGRVVLNGAGAAFPQLDNASSIYDLTLSGGRLFTFPNLALPAGQVSRLVIDNPGVTTTVPRLSANNVTVRSGNVAFAQGLIGSALEVDSGATVTLAGVSRFTYAQISGAGLIRVSGDMTFTSGTIGGPGQLLITATGHLYNIGAQYWEFGDLALTRRTVNYGTISLSSGYFGFGFGSFSFSTEIVNRGLMELAIYGYLSTTAGTGPGIAPGVITNLGRITSSGDTTLRGAGGGVRLNNLGVVQVVAGTLTLNGGVGGGGSWDTANGAHLIFGGLGSVLNAPAFTGLGQVRQAAAAFWTSPTMNGAWQLLNTVPGRLTLLGSSTFTVGEVRNDGVLRIADGASVQVAGFLTNSATLDVGLGTVHITRDLNFNPGSVVRIRSAAPADPPRITVAGNTDLKGTLVVSFAWSPQVGDVYDYMTFGSRTGQFTSTLAEGVPVPGVPLFLFSPTSARVSIAIA